MKLWNSKTQPEPLEPDRLSEIAAERIAAAERFSAAIAAAGVAMDALFAADQAFQAEYRQRHGGELYSSSRLMYQFRGALLGDLELNAPELLRYLNQPRQSRATAQSVASLIATQVRHDLSSLPTKKEPTQ
jgi:hypothetical protein